MRDIAGGPGLYSISFAQCEPALQVTVFDLPLVIPFAQEIIAHYGRQERVTAYMGNYFHDDFAGGNDLILLSNTLWTEAVESAACCWEKNSRLSRRMVN